MTIEIKVRDNESIDSALNRLNKKIRIEYGRRWYKKRYGYFEKPSILKRKKYRHLKRVKQSMRFQYQAYGKIIGNLQLNIGLKALYNRSGPTNSIGR
jgi:ribosomal protein S21